MKYLLIGTAAAALLCGACNSPEPRLNAPPHGTAERTSNLQTMYTHMIENALLANMTISDIHFLPHRAQLSPLGEERLSRLAALMEAYGGVIRFDTVAEDEELLELMRETGCAQVLIGLESPVEEGLHDLELRNDWKLRQFPRYKDAIQTIQSHGITVNGCFVIGLDGHTLGKRRQTACL